MSTQLDEATTKYVGEAQSALTSDHIPTEIIEMLGHAKGAIESITSARNQMTSDLAELDARRVMLPPAGFRQLEQKAIGEAQATHAASAKIARTAIAAIKEQLEAEALPKVDPARESLDRDTALAYLGNADGPKLGSRLLKIAESGPPEVVATLLNSTFGEGILKSRQVHAETIANARRIARVSPYRQRSPREQAAYEQIRPDDRETNATGPSTAFGKLEGALIAAETSFLQATNTRSRGIVQATHAGTIGPG